MNAGATRFYLILPGGMPVRHGADAARLQAVSGSTPDAGSSDGKGDAMAVFVDSPRGAKSMPAPSDVKRFKPLGYVIDRGYVREVRLTSASPTVISALKDAISEGGFVHTRVIQYREHGKPVMAVDTRNQSLISRIFTLASRWPKVTRLEIVSGTLQ